MTLEPGHRLGPYEVTGRLGAGGMGEIYRARDVRLGREVALKVLPRDLTADPSLAGRFAQEARSASALNHPNIITIHDIGEQEEIPFIAMELVEGRTLRELLVGRSAGDSSRAGAGDAGGRRPVGRPRARHRAP